MFLDDKKFFMLGVPAMAVVIAVIMKNSAEQLKLSNSPLNAFGPVLFAAGWAGVAYALIGNDFDVKSILAIVASSSILVSVFMMKKAMKSGKNVPKYLPVVFSISWITLGLVAGMGKNNVMKFVGGSAGFLVILSVFVILPWQRKNNVIDGPGMPLFVAGWLALIIAHSSM